MIGCRPAVGSRTLNDPATESLPLNDPAGSLARNPGGARNDPNRLNDVESKSSLDPSKSSKPNSTEDSLALESPLVLFPALIVYTSPTDFLVSKLDDKAEFRSAFAVEGTVVVVWWRRLSGSPAYPPKCVESGRPTAGVDRLSLSSDTATPGLTEVAALGVLAGRSLTSSVEARLVADASVDLTELTSNTFIGPQRGPSDVDLGLTLFLFTEDASLSLTSGIVPDI